MTALALEVLAPSDEGTAEIDLLAHVEEVISSVPGGTGERHVSLDVLCARLHAMIVGRAAEEMLADVDSLPEEAGLWAAPSWAWVFSRVHVGRKERATDGTRLRLPIRVDWVGGPLLLVDAAAGTASWSAVGLGHSGADSVPVSTSYSVFSAQTKERPTGIPTEVAVPTLSRHEIVRELERMVEAGKVAHWETLSYLEPYVTKALHLAHSSVSSELSLQWGERQTLLDETKLESIRNRMLLGDEEHTGSTGQLLERCLRPEAFRRVEPLKYIKESLRRDANAEVRRALGDPHIGPKIRRVARETGLRDLDDLVEEYRARYPKDRLSKDRALAALSVGADAMASWWGLSTYGE